MQDPSTEVLYQDLRSRRTIPNDNSVFPSTNTSPTISKDFVSFGMAEQNTIIPSERLSQGDSSALIRRSVREDNTNQVWKDYYVFYLLYPRFSLRYTFPHIRVLSQGRLGFAL